MSAALGHADSRARRLAGLTSEETEDVRGAVVLIAVGAVEQHGPHLVLGTDSWIAQRVCSDVASAAGVLLGEPVPYGCSAHHGAFSGTVSLRVATFIDIIVDIGRSLARHGLVPLFVNGHGGNRAPLGAALQTLLEQGCSAWAVTYFDTIRDEATEAFGRASMGHACALETSLALAIDDAWVRSVRVPDLDPSSLYPDPSLFGRDVVVRHRRFEEFGAEGTVGVPTLADRGKGESLRASIVERIAEIALRIQADTAEAAEEEGERP